MSKDTLDQLIRQCRLTLGDARLRDQLSVLLESSTGASSTLTIVANAGVHHLPKRLCRGEVFIASKGSFDLSGARALKIAYTSILSRVARKLRSRTWSRIYLVPFGHSSLAMQIKLLVFHVTRIETIDVVYAGNGKYFDLPLNQRSIITDRSQ